MKERELRHIKINAALSLVYFVAIIIAVIATTDTTQAQGDGQSTEVAASLKYELPKMTNANASEKVIEHVGYTVSFNTKHNIPNWVAYDLTSEEVAGVTPRAKHFEPDPQIIGCPTTDEYKNSGYDRGHMAPAGDMKWSEQAMNESFYLSNICPQNHNLNGGDWKALEEHLRTMATQYEKVYIACGPIVSAKPKTIGTSNQIAVPDAFFKAVLRKKGESWSAIGFMMPNVAGHKSLSKYAMSIDEIEIITDMDFFVALPDSIEEKIESVYNLKDWDL